MDKSHEDKKTGIQEYDKLKASVATLVGGNSDGKNLYLEVEVFDGEHNNRFEPVFPLNTSAEEITQYLKSIIEKNPKLPTEVVSLLQRKIFWDTKKEGWFSQFANEEAVSIDDKHKKDEHHGKK